MCRSGQKLGKIIPGVVSVTAIDVTFPVMVRLMPELTQIVEAGYATP